MQIDCSEIKEFRHCQRKWQLSSRNQFHLRPFVQPKAFQLGTVFHNCLHKLYVGKPLDEILEYLTDEMQSSAPEDSIMLKNMITGYATEQMPLDEHFRVLDIESQFQFKVSDAVEYLGFTEKEIKEIWGNGIENDEIIGSIDMIALNTETNEVWGFEHKTAKNFRDDTYLWMDEQPRIYTVALMLWVAQYNLGKSQNERVKLGGIYINEVRKLMRKFEIKRRGLKYKLDDLRNFMFSIFSSVAACHTRVSNPAIPRVPQPDFMTCSMCQFNAICQQYQYADIDLKDLLAEFSQEYHVRETDHLTEKEDVV